VKQIERADCMKAEKGRIFRVVTKQAETMALQREDYENRVKDYRHSQTTSNGGLKIEAKVNCMIFTGSQIEVYIHKPIVSTNSILPRGSDG